MSIVTRVHRSVQRWLRHAPLTLLETSLVDDIVRGISEKKSCHLSEIARACRDNLPLRVTEHRLSKQLAKRSSSLDRLPCAWLDHVAPVATRLPFVSVDLTEIAKPYGRAFEHLDFVRDGSRPGTPTEPGYWLVTIEASDETHSHLPLVLEPFSTQDPCYAGWSETIQRAVSAAARVANPDATWLFDRGFDDKATMRVLDALGLHWTIRLKRSRNVEVGDRAYPQRWNVAAFASHLRKPHSVALEHVDKSTHRLRSCGVSFGYAPVRIEGRTYTLVVVTGTRRHDWLLLTNRPLRTAKEAARIVQAYVRRWGNEEWTRFFKQATGLEDLRVRGWVSIRRLVTLAMGAVGVQALWLLTRRKTIEPLLHRVKSFFAVVPFLSYRLWEGTAAALAHGS